MYIYIIFFILSFLCIAIGRKVRNKKMLSGIFEIIGIFLLAFLAAIRDTSIGTDVMVYVKPAFDILLESGDINFVSTIFNIEKGYVLFNYITLIFTSDFSIYLFLVQFFIIGFAYFGIKKLYPKNYLLVYILFILIFYNRSLNLVRQSMAISLTIYSLKYLFAGKNKKFFFIVFIAYFFHKTSPIFILIYFVYKLLIREKTNECLLAFSILLMSLILLFAFPQVVSLLVNFGLLSSKYLYYLTNYVLDTLDFNYVEVILDLFLVLLYFLFSKTYNKKDEKSKFYFILLVIDLMCLIISGRYIAAYRMGMYFKIPAILYFLSNLKMIITEKNGRNAFANCLGIFIAFIFWYCMYVIGNDGNTIPFVSELFM